MALALGWLAIAGIGNAFIGPAHGIIRFLALIYAITAIVAAIGLWKMRMWAFPAYLIWAMAVILTMIAMQFGQYKTNFLIFAGFGCFVIFLLWLLAKYVKGTLNKNVEHACARDTQ